MTFNFSDLHKKNKGRRRKKIYSSQDILHNKRNTSNDVIHNSSNVLHADGQLNKSDSLLNNISLDESSEGVLHNKRNTSNDILHKSKDVIHDDNSSLHAQNSDNISEERLLDLEYQIADLKENLAFSNESLANTITNLDHKINEMPISRNITVDKVFITLENSSSSFALKLKSHMDIKGVWSENNSNRVLNRLREYTFWLIEEGLIR